MLARINLHADWLNSSRAADTSLRTTVILSPCPIFVRIRPAILGSIGYEAEIRAKPVGLW